MRILKFHPVFLVTLLLPITVTADDLPIDTYEYIPPATSSCAEVTAINGSAQTSECSAPSQIQIDDLIGQGNRVMVGPGSSVTFLYPNGCKVVVPEESYYIVHQPASPCDESDAVSPFSADKEPFVASYSPDRDPTNQVDPSEVGISEYYSLERQSIEPAEGSSDPTAGGPRIIEKTGDVAQVTQCGNPVDVNTGTALGNGSHMVTGSDPDTLVSVAWPDGCSSTIGPNALLICQQSPCLLPAAAAGISPWWGAVPVAAGIGLGLGFGLDNGGNPLILPQPVTSE